MSKTNQKMSKSIIDSRWLDHVYLDAACRERFVTLQNVPQLADKNLVMAGLAELETEYHVERKGPNVHTLLFREGRNFKIWQIEFPKVELCP